MVEGHRHHRSEKNGTKKKVMISLMRASKEVTFEDERDRTDMAKRHRRAAGAASPEYDGASAVDHSQTASITRWA